MFAVGVVLFLAGFWLSWDALDGSDRDVWSVRLGRIGAVLMCASWLIWLWRVLP